MNIFGPEKERGAALLTVLLLVAVMAVVSATAVERLTLATRLAGSGAAIEQARHFTLAGEALAMRRIETLLDSDRGQTTLAGGWHNHPFTLPLPGGSAELTLADAGNCFNLNSLVAESTAGGGAQRPLAIEQYIALMQALGIERGVADRIAAGSGDWIDADQNESPLGAEDGVYSGSSPPYRTADRPMVDASELTAIAGMTPQLWQRLRQWTCALPTSDLSPINVNTLLPEQAPLLMMLIPARISPEQARAHLAARPADGYGSLNRFWTAPALGGATPSGDAASQVKLVSRWFRLTTKVRLGDVTLTSESLIDAGDRPARVVRRRWGSES
jgi:general secretion pathway protein K